MTKKRAPGGGRKPLYPEKTTKVAVTLLPEQVEAMKQLGNGNLSAGIRKAITMNTKLYDHDTIHNAASYAQHRVDNANESVYEACSGQLVLMQIRYEAHIKKLNEYIEALKQNMAEPT